MKIKSIILLALLLVMYSCKKEPKIKDMNSANILFYNVENLFDTINDPKTHDDDFTPDGYKRWDTRRYFHKINNLTKVIESSFGGSNLPILVGLAEIENEDVLEDLVESHALLPHQYNFAHVDSPDERGIDVGLLYREEYFKLKEYEAIPVFFKRNPSDKTRDILHVVGEMMGEEVHVFVNHWSSRREGREESEHKRIDAAETLKYQIDKVESKNPKAYIIIMGDFNDGPTNNSIWKTLKARKIGDKKANLYNVVYDLDRAGDGSYSHKGDWTMLDQFIVSKNFIDNTDSLQVDVNDASVFDESWILFKHPKYKTIQPNKTYSGKKYHGGYSDHLPIKMKITKKK